jgi:hypothetical protein
MFRSLGEMRRRDGGHITDGQADTVSIYYPPLLVTFTFV